MKINEVLNEGPFLNKIGTAVGNAVGTAAKGVGAVAGGIAGLGAAAKKGFAAGKSTVAGAGDVAPQPTAMPTTPTQPVGGTTPAPTPTPTPAPQTTTATTTKTPMQPTAKTGGSMLGSLAAGAVKTAAAFGHKDSEEAAAFLNRDADQKAQLDKAKQNAQTTEPGKTAFDQMTSQLTKDKEQQQQQQTPQPTPATTMTKDQILQWISRNSEDHATLKSFADGIGIKTKAEPKPGDANYYGKGDPEETKKAVAKMSDEQLQSFVSKPGTDPNNPHIQIAKAELERRKATTTTTKPPVNTKPATPDYSNLGKGAFPGYGKASYGNVTYSGLPKSKAPAKQPAPVAEGKKK